MLLKYPHKSTIKLIDFGSSCFEDERVYTYIQSRFYRSPEVILGLPYDLAIDMWSFGCILSELYTGYPLFPGENETEQMQCIMEILGPPPKRLINECTRKKAFFDAYGKPLIIPNTRGKIRHPASKDLSQATKCNDPQFLSFLRRCLRWDPKVRITPEKALEHPWILEALEKPRTLTTAGGTIPMNTQANTNMPMLPKTPQGHSGGYSQSQVKANTKPTYSATPPDDMEDAPVSSSMPVSTAIHSSSYANASSSALFSPSTTSHPVQSIPSQSNLNSSKLRPVRTANVQVIPTSSAAYQSIQQQQQQQQMNMGMNGQSMNVQNGQTQGFNSFGMTQPTPQIFSTGGFSNTQSMNKHMFPPINPAQSTGGKSTGYTKTHNDMQEADVMEVDY